MLKIQMMSRIWDWLRWKVVSAFQRRKRGFDDSELWSLDYTILEFILPRLRRFREKKRWGWPGPCAIFDIDWDDFEALEDSEKADLDQASIEEWDRMLDKMIRAIELNLKYQGLFATYSKETDRLEEAPYLKAEYEEGWFIFIKWFHALWD